MRDEAMVDIRIWEMWEREGEGGVRFEMFRRLQIDTNSSPHR